MRVTVDGCMGPIEIEIDDPVKVTKLLTKLVNIGERWRNTPIVDDNFPSLRDEFDAALHEAKCYLQSKENEE